MTGRRRMLDALVKEIPLRLDRIFEMPSKIEEEKGACATYSRVLAEVLGEFGVKAEVRPVYVETANMVAIQYLNKEIGREEAKRRGGRIQVWGDIKEGQHYQHAVCYIPAWDAVVDLAMTRRVSGLVPSQPYWATTGDFPWWIVTFRFKTYRLDYRAYETELEKVNRAKDAIRKFLERYYG